MPKKQKPKPISRLIGDRMVKADEHASEFQITYNQLTPLLGQNIDNIKKILDLVKTLQNTGQELLHDLEIIHGYALEGSEISTEHADDMSQLATLMLNFDVFIQSDPRLAKHMLETVDIKILEDALGKMDEKRKRQLQYIFSEINNG